MKSIQDKVGTILTSETERDAIHVAVIPAVAEVELHPGEWVGYKDGVATKIGEMIGVVDPFLRYPVQSGKRFYLFVKPNTIVSLRHMWSSPFVADEVPSTTFTKEESEQWLRTFCDTADCPDYDTVIAAAVGDPLPQEEGAHGYNPNEDVYYELQEGWSDNGEKTLYFNNRDAHSSIPPEFWEHIENVTGKKVAPENRATSFSCSC